MLFTPGDIGLDVQLVEAVSHVFEHLREVDVALGCSLGDEVIDRGVALGVQGGEAEVLELGLDLLDPEPVRQRCIDVERFPGGSLLLPTWHGTDGAQIVQAVAQLDEQHAQVFRHGDEHLAEGGGLLGLFGVEVQPIELGDTVDDRRHLGPEGRLDIEHGARGVLDRVVQQRSGNGVLVETEPGHDLRHRHRVDDVGLAGLATLGGMGLGRHPVGPGDEVDLLVPALALEPGDEVADLLFQRLAFTTPGQYSVGTHHFSTLAPASVGTRTLLSEAVLWARWSSSAWAWPPERPSRAACS